MAAKLSGRPIYEVVQMSLEAALLDSKARQKLFKEPKLEILDTIWDAKSRGGSRLGRHLSMRVEGCWSVPFFEFGAVGGTRKPF